MPTQSLIYENAVPLSKERHGKWSVEVGGNFNYTKSLNALPILAAEFLVAAREYPIVFSKGSDDSIQPVVLLGMREGENLFLDAAGQWTAQYLPAFLRRYPFIFARSEDGKTFTLCIDETFEGFNQDSRGERLWDDDGKASPYVNNVLQFLQNFQTEHARTQAFCQRLAEFDLLQPQNAVWTGPGGEKAAVTGFLCVNRDKLKTLTHQAMINMIGSGEMDLMYAHLGSMTNFNQIKNKLAFTSGETAPGAKKKSAKK